MRKLIQQTDFGNFVIGTGYYNKAVLTREDVIEMLKTIKLEYFSLLGPSGIH